MGGKIWGVAAVVADCPGTFAPLHTIHTARGVLEMWVRIGVVLASGKETEGTVSLRTMVEMRSHQGAKASQRTRLE